MAEAPAAATWAAATAAAEPRAVDAVTAVLVAPPPGGVEVPQAVV
jgi:hypothetical protein